MNFFLEMTEFEVEKCADSTPMCQGTLLDKYCKDNDVIR